MLFPHLMKKIYNLFFASLLNIYGITACRSAEGISADLCCVPDLNFVFFSFICWCQLKHIDSQTTMFNLLNSYLH